MAETIVTLIAIVAVVAVATVAFAMWAVLLVGRIGFALLMMPFKLLAAGLPRTDLRTTTTQSTNRQRVERSAAGMPSIRIAHVGVTCRNRLCRKPNADRATFCARCGASLSDEPNRVGGSAGFPVYA